MGGEKKKLCVCKSADKSNTHKEEKKNKWLKSVERKMKDPICEMWYNHWTLKPSDNITLGNMKRDESHMKHDALFALMQRGYMKDAHRQPEMTCEIKRGWVGLCTPLPE